MKRKREMKRLLCAILSVVLTLGALPASALAAEVPGGRNAGYAETAQKENTEAVWKESASSGQEDSQATKSAPSGQEDSQAAESAPSGQDSEQSENVPSRQEDSRTAESGAPGAAGDNESEDETAVQSVKKLLTWNYIKGDNTAKNNIMSSLYLPETIEGYEGVRISWASSRPEALAPDGTVTRPALGKGNVSSIKLTASVAKGESKAEVSITGLTVKAVTTYEDKLEKDVLWLRETWAPEQNLQALTGDIALPAKGGEGGCTIKWSVSDESVITAEGMISRAEAGGKIKTAELTANLSSSTYKRTVAFQAAVLPWDEEGQAAKDRAVEAFQAVFAGVSFPETVDASNQAAATRLVKPLRGPVEERYAAARAAGASVSELDGIAQYQAFLNTEAALKKLNKTITIVLVDADKNADGSYRTGGYRFPKSKAVIPGDEKNDVRSAVSGLEKSGADLFEGKSGPTAAFFIIKNGVQIKADDGYVWNYAVDGVRQGTFSYSSSAVQPLDHGDTLTVYFAREDDDTLLKGEYAKGLPDSAQVDYDYAAPEVFDAEWLTESRILGDNASRYAVTGDLNLPVTGKSGSKIAWTSDKPEVISKTGEVTRPDSTASDANVTLTAVIGTLRTKKQTKEFAFTVKAMAESTDSKTLAYAAEELTLGGLDAVTSDLSLPDTGFGGVSVTWKSSLPFVITDEGKVTRQAEDTEVTLTATLACNGKTRTKEFTAKVLKIAESDEEKLAYDKAALTFDAIRGENEAEDSIRSDLMLPEQGAMGSAITWQSDSGILLTDGKVIRSADAGKVKLTASLVCGQARAQVVFDLTVAALDEAEQIRLDAEKELAALPDAFSIGIEDRETAQEQARQAEAAVERAVEAGADRESISGIDRLDRLQGKLENLPVEMTFSIVGAEIVNRKITEKKLLIGPIKLLVPANSTVSDVTQAIIRGYDSVRPGSGASYYGTILGLSQLDAGSASGWTYGGKGEKLNFSAGSAESFVTQGCVVYWNFVGEAADGAKLQSLNELGVTSALPEDAPVGKNLVPKTDISGLEALLEESRGLLREDWRDYGPWKGSWEKMRAAAEAAEWIAAAKDTALGYEIEEAEAALREALEALQPVSLDTTGLRSLVERAGKLDKNDYYEAGWNALETVLSAAREVLNDPYSETGVVAAMESALQEAIDLLLPVSQPDKTLLQAVLDQCEQRKAEEYTYASWQRLEKVREEARAVMDDAYASAEQTDEAVTKLQNALNSLIRVNTSIKNGNQVVYQAISDYQGTSDDWEIFDMVLLGHGSQVNESGFLDSVTALLTGETYTATDLERTAIVLTALGYDVTDVTMPDGSTFDFMEELEKQDLENVGVNAVAFALLAADSGEYEIGRFRTDLRDALLRLQNPDGGWPISAGGDSETDMTSIVITALSPYTGDAGVKAAVSRGFASLEKKRDMLVSTPDKYKGNSNSTAMAMIAYAAAPSFTDGTTLSYFSTGGLSYYITDNNRLGYAGNTADNALATEQGVRAYAALDRFEDKNGSPVNIYRFGKPDGKLLLKEAEPPVISTDLESRTTEEAEISFHISAKTPDGTPAKLNVTVNGEKIAPQSDGSYRTALREGLNSIVIEAVGENGSVTIQSYNIIRKSPDQIRVYFTLMGDRAHGSGEGGVHTLASGNLETWIGRGEYAVDAGASVMEVFCAALLGSAGEDGARYSWSNDGIKDGTEGGYIESITSPEGVTLGEFTNGPKSGWMYTVNGEHETLGMKDRRLQDGDEIIFHYTDDYTKEQGKPEPGTEEDPDIQKTTAEEIEDAYRKTGDYLSGLADKNGLQVSSVGGDWAALGLARSGRMTGAQREAYYENVLRFVEENADEKERLHEFKSTENARVILGLTAVGRDPSDVGGHNLLKGLADMDDLEWQGINGPIWALIAFDSHGYEIPRTEDGGRQTTRESLIFTILSSQLPDGGWDLGGMRADPDMTAMAVLALAPYYDGNMLVSAAVDKAVGTLSRLQSDNGGYVSFGDNNVESCAQVVTALAALGINPATDSRFVKNGRSVMDALMSFYVNGGGFCHVTGGKIDAMATEQGYYALTAYRRFVNGMPDLYDMSDVAITAGGSGSGGSGDSGSGSGSDESASGSGNTSGGASGSSGDNSSSASGSGNADESGDSGSGNTGGSDSGSSGNNGSSGGNGSDESASGSSGNNGSVDGIGSAGGVRRISGKRLTGRNLLTASSKAGTEKAAENPENAETAQTGWRFTGGTYEPEQSNGRLAAADGGADSVPLARTAVEDRSYIWLFVLLGCGVILLILIVRCRKRREQAGK